MKSNWTARLCFVLSLAFLCIQCRKEPAPPVPPVHAEVAEKEKPAGLEWKRSGMPNAWSSSDPRGSYFIYNNTPYVFFGMDGYGYPYHHVGVVMRYDNDQWAPVGPTLYTPSDTDMASLVVHDGVPYLGFVVGSEGKHKHTANVLRYDGREWKEIGEEWKGQGTAWGLSLAIKNDTLYLAYLTHHYDGTDSGGVSVLAFDGEAWKQMGRKILNRKGHSISLDLSGPVPFLAFSRYRKSPKDSGAVVGMRYDSSDWRDAGPEIPIHGPATFLATHLRGLPAVVFTDTVRLLDGAAYRALPVPDSLRGILARFSVNDTLHVSTINSPSPAEWAANYLVSPDRPGITAQTRLKPLPPNPFWRNLGPHHFSQGRLAFAMSRGIAYVAHAEESNYERKKGKLTVVKYVEEGWQPIGRPIPTDFDAENLSLVVANDTLYVAYTDSGAQQRVRKFDGKKWVKLGKGLPGERSESGILVVDGGTPYLAFRNSEDGGKVSVWRYAGGEWMPLGQRGISVGYVDGYVHLSVESGVPYLAYFDSFLEFKAVVKKFTGSAWEPVCEPRRSAGGSYYTVGLHVHGGRPYMAYSMGDSTRSVHVERWADTGWVSLGSIPGAVHPFALRMQVDGESLYLAYVPDFGHSARSSAAAVWKFTGSAWEELGWEGKLYGIPHLQVSGGMPFVATEGDTGNSVMYYK